MRLLSLAAALCATVSVLHADTPPDLKDYRTVATAKTTAIAAATRAADSRPGYLGVEFANGNATAPAVIGVEPGSPAEKAGIKPGDVIAKVGDAEVATAKAFREAVQALGEGA